MCLVVCCRCVERGVASALVLCWRGERADAVDLEVFSCRASWPAGASDQGGRPPVRGASFRQVLLRGGLQGRSTDWLAGGAMRRRSPQTNTSCRPFPPCLQSENENVGRADGLKEVSATTNPRPDDRLLTRLGAGLPGGGREGRKEAVIVILYRLRVTFRECGRRTLCVSYPRPGLALEWWRPMKPTSRSAPTPGPTGGKGRGRGGGGSSGGFSR